MPSVSIPDLAKLRTTQHATRLYLCVYKPATIWTALVDGAQTAGSTAITVKTVVQTRAPARHYQVLFGTTAGGDELGEARWKSYGALTLNVGTHNAALPNNAYITVKEEIKPRAVHVYMSPADVVYEDETIAYTDENVDYSPLARIGCPPVEFRDPTTGLAMVNFWSSSTAIAPGATIASHAWDFKDGVPASSAIAGTAVAPIAVVFNSATPRYVTYTCTDSNGKTHTRYIPVLTPNRSGAGAPYSQIEVTNLSGDVGSGGWLASLRVYGAADVSEFPDNAMVVLFARDFYGDTLGSIGGQWTHRENIVFTGYIVNGTVKQSAATGAVEFEVEGVGVFAERLAALASTLVTAVAPTGWHELAGLSYNLACHHLLTQHSTLSNIADVNLGLLTYLDNAIDLTEGSLRGQLDQSLASIVRGQFGSSAQGMIYLQSDPQKLPVASRSNTAVISTQFVDLRDEIDLGDETMARITSQVDFGGKLANDDPVFSLAPADPWFDGISSKVDGLRADTQNEGNEIAGIIEGVENNQFNDILINWRGNYRVFDPFPAEPLHLTITAAQNLRDLVWTNQRCWTRRVNYEYRPSGILLVSSGLEKDSVPSTGITGNYPAEPPVLPPTPPPPVVPPPVPPVPPVPPIPYPNGKGNLLYVSTLKGLAKCVMAYGTDGTDGVPVWSNVSGTLAGNALKFRWFNLDAFSLDPTNDHFTAGWATTDDGLYRVTGLPDAPVWTQQLTTADCATLLGTALVDTVMLPTFTPSIFTPGLVMTMAGYGNNPPGGHGQLHLIWSTDYGATWQTDMANFITCPGVGGIPVSVSSSMQLVTSFHVSNRHYVSGQVTGMNGILDTASPNPFAAAFSISGANVTFTLWHSHGAPLTNDYHLYNRLYMPFCGNSGIPYTDDARAYTHRVEFSNGITQLRRFTTFGTPAWSPGYTPSASTDVGHALMPNQGATSLGLEWYFTNMFDEDYGVGIDANGRLYYTNDRCATWTTQLNNVIGGRTLSPFYQFCIPVDPEIVFLSGVASAGGGLGMIVLTTDLGATYVDVSNAGMADGIDTVMGLVGGDLVLNNNTIFVDYFRV